MRVYPHRDITKGERVQIAYVQNPPHQIHDVLCVVSPIDAVVYNHT